MKRLYNIKGLKFWKELEEMGFQTCRFNFRDVYLIGATRQMKDGTEITIEPLLLRTGARKEQDFHIHHISLTTPLNITTTAKYLQSNVVRHLKTIVAEKGTYKIFKEDGLQPIA